MLRPDDAYERYERAWNEPERTAALLAECWAEDGIYADDEVPEGVVGPGAHGPNRGDARRVARLLGPG